MYEIPTYRHIINEVIDFIIAGAHRFAVNNKVSFGIYMPSLVS
jgi:hypothetical protein